MDPSTLLSLVIPISISGIFSGIIAGLFGVGGGIILVPAIVFTMEFIGYDSIITMHLGVATSLALIVPTAISSSIGHHKRGVVDYYIIRNLAPTLVIGSLLGAILAQNTSGDGLRLLFGIMAIFASFNMMKKNQYIIGKEMPSFFVLNWVIGLVIGTVSAMVGIGGGALSIPLMNGFSVSQHRATGTAAVIGLVIAIPGAVIFSLANTSGLNFPPWSFGMISLPVFVVFFPLTIIGAQLGVIIAYKLNGLILRRIFSVFLFIMAVRMLLVAII